MCVGFGGRLGAGQWLQRLISELLRKASMTSALMREGWWWVRKPCGWESFVCAENWWCNTAFLRDTTGEFIRFQKKIMGRCWNTKQCLMTLKDRKEDPSYLFVLECRGGREGQGNLVVQVTRRLRGNHARLWGLAGPILGDLFLLECP